MINNNKLPAIREESATYFGYPRSILIGQSSNNRRHSSHEDNYAIHFYRDFKLYEGKPSLIQPKNILDYRYSWSEEFFSFAQRSKKLNDLQSSGSS